MLLTLALVVFAGAIFIFFSQEFMRTLKKIFAIKGAKLLLPLAIASWLVFNFDFWFLWIIYYTREVLQALFSPINWFIPVHWGSASLALVVFLTLIATVPIVIIDWIMRKRTYKTFPHPYFASTLIWLISSFLMIIV